MIASPMVTFGPFVHQLNKGGLHEILTTRKLRGTAAANYMTSDMPAVRAHVGDFETLRKRNNWSDRRITYIEFTSEIPPRKGTPPGLAEWREEELIAGHLPIRILRVLNGAGESVALA